MLYTLFVFTFYFYFQLINQLIKSLISEFQNYLYNNIKIIINDEKKKKKKHYYYINLYNIIFYIYIVQYTPIERNNEKIK